MKLSTRSRYGSRALFDIALHSNSGSCKLMDIAQRQAISPKYLDHIFSALKKAGLIKNIRGRNGGGYSLTRPASMITMKDIVQAVEGSISPVECIDSPEKCDRVCLCPTRDIWVELKEAMEKSLASKTLQNLLDSHKNRKPQHQFNYTI